MATNSKRVAVVVVTLPAEIDIANSDDVYMEICSAITSASGVVVADLTGTAFCDCSGAREISCAWQFAAQAGVELRLVIPPGRVLRFLQLTGLDRVWLPYPTLHAALDQTPARLEKAGFLRRHHGAGS